jgi:YVTN family beta-propeller protein
MTYQINVDGLLDYDVETLPLEERKPSLGDPRGVLWSPDGSRVFVSGMGSDNVAVFDKTGARGEEVVPVGEGPTGMVLSADGKKLFVLNRFGSSVSTIDLDSMAVTLSAAFFDSTPEEVKLGRKVFYNTHLTSGLGQVSCASCHVDARFDRLAWDLGNPEKKEKFMGSMTVLSESLTRLHVSMHPMKGPMVTQTMQDLDKKGPFHWRGDMLSIRDFNAAFVGLLGREAEISDEMMDAFETYLGTIHFPPNPYRRADNSLSTSIPLPGRFTTGAFGEAGQPLPNGNASRGFKTLFSRTKHPMLGNATCLDCHSQTTGLGNPLSFSEHAVTDRTPATQDIFKVVQLRGLYDKEGFTTAKNRSLTGFGFFHDGSVDTLERFLSSDMFALKSDQDVSDVLAFLLSFSGNESTQTEKGGWSRGAVVESVASRESHALTGTQVTLLPTEKAKSRQKKIQSITNFSRSDVDIIATMSDEAGNMIPLRWTRAKFENANRTHSYSPPAFSRVPGFVTLLAVPKATATRVDRNFLDRDGDGLPDEFETRTLDSQLVEAMGGFIPFQPSVEDVSSDFFLMEPDGIPDGENDFDGDGVINSVEASGGTDVFTNWRDAFGIVEEVPPVVEVPLPPVRIPTEPGEIPRLGDSDIDFRVSLVSKTVIRIEWTAHPSATYRLERSHNLLLWQKIAGTYHAEANAPTPIRVQLLKQDSNRFVRIIESIGPQR